jgi:hypothetical protein
MPLSWQHRFKRDTFDRMAENIEHAVTLHAQLELEPEAVRVHLRNAAFYLRKAVEIWPETEG